MLRLGHQARGSRLEQAMGAGRCGHITNYNRVLNMRSMYKIDGRRGGVQKAFSRKLPIFHCRSLIIKLTKFSSI